MSVRTDRASLRQIGLLSNPLLLGAILIELVLTAAVVYLPEANTVFGTRPLEWQQVVVLSIFPFVVWSVDELRRSWARHRGPRRGTARS